MSLSSETEFRLFGSGLKYTPEHRDAFKNQVRLLSSTPKARFYGHRFSGKARFSGQNCYDGTTVFSNSGNFNIADSFGGIFASKVSKNDFDIGFIEPSISVLLTPRKRLINHSSCILFHLKCEKTLFCPQSVFNKYIYLLVFDADPI